MADRLDKLVFSRGLADSLMRARSEIRAGNVLVDNRVADKPGVKVANDAAIRLQKPRNKFVSRGGFKLEAALDFFAVNVENLVCADLGSSTGGFTDCLLQRGASRVYAIDVGYGQLAWSLRTDSRVVTLERTNARHLNALPEPISLLVGDLSFVSLRTMLPTVARLCLPAARAILLVKPQFELARNKVGARGLVLEPEARAEALQSVTATAEALGLPVLGSLESPLPGLKSGNREWLVYLGAPRS